MRSLSRMLRISSSVTSPYADPGMQEARMPCPPAKPGLQGKTGRAWSPPAEGRGSVSITKRSVARW